MTDAEETLRTAHELINRDLTTAGDGLKGLGTIEVPKTFVQNYLTQTPIVDPLNPNYVNLALVTSDDSLPSGTAIPQASPVVTALTGCDRITMLTVDYTGFTPIPLLAGKITQSGSNTVIQLASAAETNRFQVGEIYAITTDDSAAFGMISSINTSTNKLTMTNGDVYGLNETGSTTPLFLATTMVSGASTQSATITRLQIIHYYANSNSLLVRRVFGVKGAGFVDSTLSCSCGCASCLNAACG